MVPSTLLLKLLMSCLHAGRIQDTSGVCNAEDHTTPSPAPDVVVHVGIIATSCLPLHSQSATRMQRADGASRLRLLATLAVLLLALLTTPLTAGAATIVSVSTPGQLKLALESGQQHVEITKHMDLSKLEKNVMSPDDDPDLFRPLPSTKSIVVRLPC
jgi:hypothetical protein